jgi:hypothetical protein
MRWVILGDTPPNSEAYSGPTTSCADHQHSLLVARSITSRRDIYREERAAVAAALAFWIGRARRVVLGLCCSLIEPD